MNFNSEQQRYLQGFFAGASQRGFRFADVMEDPVALATPSAEETEPERLAKEEKIKRAGDPLDSYNRLRQLARTGQGPEPDDLFRLKWNGLFWLAPTGDGYMCRLRIPGGRITSAQFREVASISRDLAGGFGQITTRNNLQIRTIAPQDAPEVLRRLQACGLSSKGSGGDNIRNITASPTAGLDPHEMIDVMPLVDDLAMAIQNSRQYYDLPRKFNIALDGGGIVSCAEDTNDVGLRAFALMELPENHPLAGKAEPGIYFQLLLGGVTGHKRFAEDAGVIVPVDEAVDLCLAVVRAYLKNGNRGQRAKSRLVYLLEDWGYERFLAEVENELGRPLLRTPWTELEASGAVRTPHRPNIPLPQYGVRPQKQPGLCSIGVETPVGIVPAERMDALADIAERFGSGELRLTIFQNILLPNIPAGKVEEALAAIETAGLRATSSMVAGGLVACTGNQYCKFANVDTKGKGVELVRFLEQRIELDQPLNIHVTGCPHSCAQHYIGDLGLLGTKVDRGGERVEGFHVFIGGGFGANKRLGRMLFKGIAAGEETNVRILALLTIYLERRAEAQPFHAWCNGQDLEALAASVEERIAASVAA